MVLNLLYDNNAKNQLWFDHLSNGIQYRYRDVNGWKNWKQIAFTDSTVARASILKGANNTLEPSPILPSDFSESYKAITTRYRTSDAVYPTTIVVSGAWQNWELGITESTQRTNRGLRFRVSGNEEWYPWRDVAFIDSNVASASRLKPIQLTNEDLDTLKESQLTFYLCEVANTCTNKPEGVVQFSLVVYYCGHGYIAQILTSHTGVMYKRGYDGATKTWSAWQQLAITDGAVARLTPQRLIDEDLNTLVAGFKVYYAVNTTHNNAPANAKYFSLEVFNASGDITQVANLANGTSYRRKYQNNTWSAWKKMLTEDDLPTAKSLTTEDLNTLKTPNTSYYANTGNTCKNKPVDATNGTDYTKVGFGLEVSKVASKILQTIIIEDGSRYFRFFENNIWGTWR